jgi:Leucine-rich repeat (LRR) protein
VNAQLCVVNINRERVDSNFCTNGPPFCTSLKIVSSVLKGIPAQLEECYPSITELDVKQCRIVTIELTFRHDKLKILNLAGNQLTKLHSDDFIRVRALEILDLSHNLIIVLPLKSFNGLKLKTLKLSANRIKTIASYSNDLVNELVACKNFH